MPTIDYEPLPAPSAFELPKQAPLAPPGFVISFVIALRTALRRLANALAPADLVLFEDTTGMGKTQLLGAVARYGIADILGDESMTAPHIAERVNIDPDLLHRTLRALSNLGYFQMSSDGRFANNRLSRALRSGTLTRNREWAIYFASGSNSAAWCDFSRTLATGKSPFDRVHGMNVWEWFDAHPDEREMFASVMMGITLRDAPIVARLYPFAEIEVLCDVGGGRGTLLSEVLGRHPHLRGILCDGAGVIESARSLLEERGLTDRVELAAGSFFEKVPSGADAYMMKNILHDWNDETCEKILRVVRRAMKPNARLLLCESIIEKTGRDPLAALADLHMAVACSEGRERSVEDFKRLMDRSGFALKRVFPFPTTSVLEGIAI